MSDKKSKTIAGYAIRKWLENEGFQMECFKLKIIGNRALLVDMRGDKLILTYDSDTHSVYVKGAEDYEFVF